MTRSNKDKNPPADGRKTRNYKPESGRSVTIEVGDSIEGVFQGEKTITITDQNTKEKKDIRMFQFRDADGLRFVILGRSMLDQAFDDLYEAEGGEEKAIGLNMRISRPEDRKLPGKRTMGIYSIDVWEE